MRRIHYAVFFLGYIALMVAASGMVSYLISVIVERLNNGAV